MKLTFNKKCKFISSALKTSKQNNSYSICSIMFDKIVHPNIFTQGQIDNFQFGEDVNVEFELDYNTKYPGLKILKITK